MMHLTIQPEVLATQRIVLTGSELRVVGAKLPERCRLSPFAAWWDDTTQIVRLDGLDVVALRSGDWVQPETMGTLKEWSAWKTACVSVVQDGADVVFKLTGDATRHIGIGKYESYSQHRPDRLRPQPDEIATWGLDWPTTSTHPHVWVDADPRPVTADEVTKLRNYLAGEGDYDIFRETPKAVALYDRVMGSELAEPAFREQMAKLGYVVASPSTWSDERGYRSGNINMSFAFAAASGLIGCALQDHPLSRQWIDNAAARMVIWLDKYVGQRGEWIEAPHYANAVATIANGFALAASRHGNRALRECDALRRLSHWVASIQSPRDPREGRKNRRSSPMVGRGSAGLAWAGSGIAAAVHGDPQLQWAWAGTDYELRSTGSNALGGFEQLVCDRNALQVNPEWTSELNDWGCVLRQNVGTDHEDQIVVPLSQSAGLQVAEIGTLSAIWLAGIPVGGSFTLAERHQCLLSKVSPPIIAMSSENAGCRVEVLEQQFHTHKDVDTLQATFKLTNWQSRDSEPVTGLPSNADTPVFPLIWTRKLEYHRTANVLEIADTVQGGPSQWQLWLDTRDEPHEAKPLEGNELAIGHVKLTVLSKHERRFTAVWGHRYVDYGVVGVDRKRLVQLQANDDTQYRVRLRIVNIGE